MNHAPRVMRRSCIYWFFLFINVGWGVHGLVHSYEWYPFNGHANKILSVAPEGWFLAEKRPGSVPEGFSNQDVKGELYVFCGPKDVSWNWKGKDEIWHREPFGRESVEVWFSPGSYRPGMKTYLSKKGPILPSRVYSSKNLTVYAKPGHLLTVSHQEFNDLVAQAVAMHWDDSGSDFHISWTGWKEDIVHAMKGIERFSSN